MDFTSLLKNKKGALSNRAPFLTLVDYFSITSFFVREISPELNFKR